MSVSDVRGSRTGSEVRTAGATGVNKVSGSVVTNEIGGNWLAIDGTDLEMWAVGGSGARQKSAGIWRPDDTTAPKNLNDVAVVNGEVYAVAKGLVVHRKP